MYARFMAKVATYTELTKKLHGRDSKRPISRKMTKVIRQISTDVIVFALDRISRSDDSSAPSEAAIPTAEQHRARVRQKFVAEYPLALEGGCILR
jgi:hypothetical protein